jgi:hypothetical protein
MSPGSSGESVNDRGARYSNSRCAHRPTLWPRSIGRGDSRYRGESSGGLPQFARRAYGYSARSSRGGLSIAVRRPASRRSSRSFLSFGSSRGQSFSSGARTRWQGAVRCPSSVASACRLLPVTYRLLATLVRRLDFDCAVRPRQGESGETAGQIRGAAALRASR